MKANLLVSILLVYLGFSCARSIPLNLEGIVNSKFDALNLRPSYELYDLRIDVMRQTEEVQVSEGGNKLQVFSFWKRGKDDVLRYTIEKSEHKLFIYREGGFGMIVERKANELHLQVNDELFRRYILSD